MFDRAGCRCTCPPTIRKQRLKAPTKAARLITAFKADYEKYISKAKDTLHVSMLSKRDQEDYWRRDQTLHPSSFPYCSLQSAYSRLQRPDDPELERAFGFDYFLPVGTATHTALQRWFGRSGNMIGDWRCARASCRKSYAFQPHPKKCSCGNRRFDYHELGGTWGKHVHWHTDGVYRLSDGSYWIVDFKTTSEYAIAQHRKTQSMFPYVSNVAQIETYIPLVEDNYKIEISGWLLAYISRDNPVHMWKQEFIARTVNASRRAELRAALTLADRDFGRSLQVKSQPIRVFKALVKTKICGDRDHYNQFVKDQYNPCPLAKVCFNRKKLQSELKRVADEHAAPTQSES